ncbi:hydrogenase subunit MbhD domain-containing protein [Geoalkalibacter halelectricus]|uniref:DUF4040 domain-containing protein n=1 Tax=Geoalkalibacter halelectricus TaxID=2847045 RepID=A0ABY5ZGR3_9BACT|nr:hydrogenase subunit MbhD domain-containing protein [Geoalkalibacter halelectricus]MDO3377943.1 DUF4040 domain-containing protein [Geoalkalibacter halelectricus]UWZ77876.1 DUF4040 domain-containing protein [Geoalkalibacter halelectricus]
MSELGVLFDLILLGTLVWLAWRLLASADLFKAVVLFIAFGLLLALAWARLGAPDVALAEAAIGAGITGALLLVALRRLGPETERMRRHAPTIGQRLSARLLVGIAGAAVALLVARALLGLPAVAPGLAPRVAEDLAQSGVAHPVTAVLLNFRGFDTLLEVGVLVLAVLGIWCLNEAPQLAPAQPDSPVLLGLVRLLLPLLMVAGGYLLWLGAHAPGGAFQGGALLAAAAVLGLLAGFALPRRWSGLPLRLMLAAGLAVFLAVGAAPLLGGGWFLAYPPGAAKTLILLIETLLTGSIAAVLAVAVVGGRPGEAAASYPPLAEPPVGKETS